MADERAIRAKVMQGLMAAVDANNPRQWADASPHLLEHLPAYASSAGRLAELAQDTGFLIHVDPGSLLEVLNTVTPTAPAEARLYGMAADHLQNATAAQRAAILRTTAAEENASLLARFPPTPPMSARWADIRPEPFHRKVFSHAGGVYAAAFGTLSDGTPLVATGGGDSVIRLWDPATMTLRAPLPGHTSPVVALAFGTLPDGTTLLAAGDDSSIVRLWNVGNMTVHAELPAHRGGVKNLCFGLLPNGTVLLATGDKGVMEDGLYRRGMVRFWDPVTGRLRRLLTVVPGLVSGLAFGMTSDESPLLAVGSNDGLGNGGVCVWNLATEEQLSEFGRDAIFALTFCTLPDGSTLLVTVDSWEDDESAYGNVTLWDTRTWESVARYSKKAGTVDAVASGRLPDGSTRLALSTRDGRTILVDPATSELHAACPGTKATSER